MSSDSLYKLAKIILKHYYFELGQDVCHQVLSTVIGTKFALHYEHIFMAGLKEEIFSNTELQPLLCLRYLDDIFLFVKLKEFLEFLNAFHPSVNLTMDHSPNH